MNTNDSIPARFNSRAFDRYAPAIALIVERWPGPVTLDPRPLSVETYSHRLRDAVNGAIRYGHTNPLVPLQPFREIGSLIVVSVRDGNVVAGSREATAAKAFPTVAVGQPLPSPQGTLAYGDNAAIVATMQLLSKRVVPGPFRITGIPDEPAYNELVMLSLDYDVAIERIDSSSAIVL